RTILAGMASEHQDLPALLQLLFAALSTYGCPEGIVSDHGAVFRADDYVAISRRWRLNPSTSSCASPGRTSLKRSLRGNYAWPTSSSNRLARWRRSSAYTRRLLKPLIPRGTARIRSAPIADGPRWTSWVGCAGVPSPPSVCGASLAGYSSCG